MFSASMLRLIQIILVSAGFSVFTRVKSDNSPYKRCYNTSSETYCFSEIFGPVNFSEAQQHCAENKATLPVIKNDEVQTFVESFIKESDTKDAVFFWISAYRNRKTAWRWLDCSLPPPTGFGLTTNQSERDVACLEFQPKSYSPIFNIIGQESYNTLNNYYICGCSNLQSRFENANVLRYDGKYYVAFQENVTWYEARNRCLKEDCDLASFRDLNSINFTNWIDTTPGRRYWIGLTLIEWIWNTSVSSGEPSQVTFTDWLDDHPRLLSIDCVTISKGYDSSKFQWLASLCVFGPTSYAFCQTVTSIRVTNEKDIYTRPTCDTVEPKTGEVKGTGVKVGVGVGVGVPVLIGLIAVIIV